MFRSLIFSSVLLVSVGHTVSVSAQSELPDIEAVIAEIHGKEVKLSGRIGASKNFLGPPDILFKSNDRAYRVILAVGRNQLKLIDGCQFQDYQPKSGCGVDISAEITVIGSRLELIVFDIRNLIAPE